MRSVVSTLLLLVALFVGAVALAADKITWPAKRSEREAVAALLREGQAIDERRAMLRQRLKEADEDELKLRVRWEELRDEVAERLALVKDRDRLRFRDGCFCLADVAEVATPTALPK